MRIIHTSDWHLGRRFERASLADDQRSFLGWLATVAAEERVDLVLVAGDVYDRSQPAEDAVALLDEGLDELCAAGARVALIPGNHDSARRLGFGAGRQALGGVHVFADDQHPPVPWVVSSGDERVRIVAVPFLDPYGVPAPQAADDGTPRARTHEHVLADALAAGRAQLDPGDPTPTICVAHAYVSGATESDSERALAVGGSERVDPAVFTGFDYVALGHLHRPQRIGGDESIAYSGSPLPYSFSEDHPKSVRLLELDAEGLTGIRTVPIPVGRPVVTLTGTLDELVTDPSHDRWVGHWVAVRLTDETVRTQPMERLRSRFPHAVSLRYVRTGPVSTTGPGADRAVLEERPNEDVVVQFLTEVRGRVPGGSERALVRDALATALGASDR